MELWIHDAIRWLLEALALPEVGLTAIFTISLISATLLPLGSEPAVFAYVSVSPEMLWPALFIATAGNTLGGTISYWMGAGAQRTYQKWRDTHPNEGVNESSEIKKSTGRWHQTVQKWLHKMGPSALLLSWLPVVGDPLCSVAGWLHLPLRSCIIYMAIGKFLRYLTMTTLLLWIYPYLGWGSL